MKPSALAIACIVAGCLAGPPRPAIASEAESSGTLTVVVENVDDDRGVVGVLVFKGPSGWPADTRRAVRATDVPAQRGRVALRLPNLPPGDYAVVVLHDVNANMKLERNWLGVPLEQWGMSNNPKARFSAPSFDSARFHFSGDQRIRVTLNEAQNKHVKKQNRLASYLPPPAAPGAASLVATIGCPL